MFTTLQGHHRINVGGKLCVGAVMMLRPVVYQQLEDALN